MNYDFWQTVLMALPFIGGAILYIFNLTLSRQIKEAINALRTEIYTALDNSEKDRDRFIESLRNISDRRWEVTKHNFKKLEESSNRKNQRAEFLSQRVYELEGDNQELILFLKKNNLSFFPKQKRITSYEKWKEQLPHSKDTLNLASGFVEKVEEVEDV